MHPQPQRVTSPFPTATGVNSAAYTAVSSTRRPQFVSYTGSFSAVFFFEGIEANMFLLVVILLLFGVLFCLFFC